MRRDCSHLFPLISILLLLPALSYGQAWSGILANSRAIDWSKAGLPASFPDGETTPNPWTPPTRTQCTTSQCNTVSGGNVTAATINAAISSAPASTYVLIPSGTFALGGSINMKSNVTLRGSGASSTKLTGGTISMGPGASVSSATLLTASPAKGATSVTVQSPPSAGRLVSLEQCDDGWSAANANFTIYGSGTKCSGAYSDPQGPWVCGASSTSLCNRTPGDMMGGNPHFQGHVLWIPTGGVTGSTVNFSSSLENDNWNTARTTSLAWGQTAVVGAGVEDFTLVGTAGGYTVTFYGTYACWAKGLRLITTSGTTPGSLVMDFKYDAHSLVTNSYLAGTAGGSGAYLATFGYDGGDPGQSDFLFINNIVEGGFVYGMGIQVNEVFAYNYFYTANNSSWVENGDAQHHAGTSFLLHEGNQMGSSMDDNTWGTHNFNTWFRNYISCIDPVVPTTGGPGLQIGGWARFDNAIGNALGGGQCSGSYNRGVFDVNAGTPTDNTGLTQASFMRWGNYIVCTDGNSHCNKVNWDSAEVPTNLSSFGANSTPYQNSVPATQNLPASFFMSGSTAPGWWRTCSSWGAFPTSCSATQTPAYPPIGPEVTNGQNMSGHAWNIPAAVAWASLPHDTNYSTSWGNLRQFDERVYQSSPPGDLNPPTGLTAVVQ